MGSDLDLMTPYSKSLYVCIRASCVAKSELHRSYVFLSSSLASGESKSAKSNVNLVAFFSAICLITKNDLSWTDCAGSRNEF